MIRKLGFIAGVVATVTLGTATAAWADDVDNLVPTVNYGPTCYNQTISSSHVVCQTDNAAITVYMEASVSANMRSRVRDALDNSYNPINSISITYASSEVTEGSAETDIVYQQGTIPSSGAVGITWCDDAVDATAYKCDQAYIRFINDSFYEHRMLTCHETGHAIGLTHGNRAYPTVSNTDSVLGCMRDPYDADAYTLGANNVRNINSAY